MSNFTEQFLSIANNPEKFAGNGPAQVVLDVIAHRVERNGISRDDAVAELSIRPLHGEGSGSCGGVDVVQDGDTGEVTVTYTTSDESLWMPLCLMVEQAFSVSPNSSPDWFESDWVRVTEPG
jgi:hypothetical protein